VPGGNVLKRKPLRFVNAARDADGDGQPTAGTAYHPAACPPRSMQVARLPHPNTAGGRPVEPNQSRDPATMPVSPRAPIHNVP